MSHFQPHSVVSCSPSLLQQPPQSVLTPLSNSGNLVLGIGTWTVGWKKWRSWKATRKLSIVSRISCSWQSTTKHQITGCWFISVGWAGNHMACGWEWPGQVRIWPAALCHISLSLFPINLHCICLIKQKKKSIYIYIQKPHKIPDVMDVWAIWLQKQKSQCIWTTEWVQEIEWVIKTDVSLAPLGELARNCSVHQVYWQTELNPPCSRSLPSMVEDKHLV